jgi:putative ABC transport system permease protein
MATVDLGPGQPSQARIPAVAVTSPVPDPIAEIVLPPAVAQRLELHAASYLLYVKAAAAQPAGQRAAADAALARLGIAGLNIQSPYNDGISPALPALTVGDLLLTLAAAVAATTLVGIDAADDQAILAAVGAPPSGNRRLAMSRAALICRLGSILGVAAGLVPGVGLVWRLRHQYAGPLFGSQAYYPLRLPWAELAAVALAAPILAAAAAWCFNRSRLVIRRRH